MNNTELLQKIFSRFPEAQEIPLPDPKWVRGDEPQIKVPSSCLVKLATVLKEEWGFDLLSFLTAVDWIKENRMELIYYFIRSQDPKTRLYVKTDVPRQGEPEVPSLTSLYAGADWQEREVYDLYGIRFEKHPDLRRILLWEGYPGYPLRKDYVHVQDRLDNGEEIGLPKKPVTPPPSAGTS